MSTLYKNSLVVGSGRTIAATFDSDGNRPLNMAFNVATVEDLTDYNRGDADVYRNSTLNFDATAVNLGAAGSAADWSDATSLRVIAQYLEGTGSVAIDGTVSNGIGTGIGVATLSSSRPFVDRVADGITVDSTHKAINFTVTGTIVFKLLILAKI